MSRLRHFLSELRRRRVVRVAVVYAVVAWGIMEASSVIFPSLQLPEWTTTLVVILAIMGFPLAVALAWAFEITPEGVRRTAPSPLAPEPGDEGVGGLLRRLGGEGGAGPATAERDGAAEAAAPRPAALEGAAPGGAPAEPGAEEREEPDPERLRRASLAQLRHDLRSPINAVVGYAEMLLEDASDGEPAGVAEDLRKVREAGRELQGVVDRVLSPEGVDADPSRIEHGLRTPLNTVIGFSELLLERGEQLPASFRSDLERILEAARELIGRLDEVVQVCRNGLSGEATDDDYARIAAIARDALAKIRPVDAGDVVAGGSLLVVDDTDRNRELVSRQLARQGFTVSEARSGEEALERLAGREFDLILLDILMPGMDGIEVLRRLKADPELRGVPVIVTSSIDEADTAVRCMESGAADYITKPVDPVLLRTRVEAALRTRRLGESVRSLRERLRLQEELTERVLLRSFPEEVAERVRAGETEFADHYEEATVVCAAVVGLASRAPGGDSVAEARRVGAVFGSLRSVAEEHGVGALVLGELGCTAAAGVPTPRPDHAERAASLALDWLEAVAGVRRELRSPFQLRLGLHTGPVTAGVPGEEVLAYELWGEGVELARDLEVQGLPGAIHVSPAAYARLRGSFTFEDRGVVELAGRGQMRTYLLTGPGETAA